MESLWVDLWPLLKRCHTIAVRRLQQQVVKTERNNSTSAHSGTLNVTKKIVFAHSYFASIDERTFVALFLHGYQFLDHFLLFWSQRRCIGRWAGDRHGRAPSPVVLVMLLHLLQSNLLLREHTWEEGGRRKCIISTGKKGRAPDLDRLTETHTAPAFRLLDTCAAGIAGTCAACMCPSRSGPSSCRRTAPLWSRCA